MISTQGVKSGAVWKAYKAAKDMFAMPQKKCNSDLVLGNVGTCNPLCLGSLEFEYLSWSSG